MKKIAALAGSLLIAGLVSSPALAQGQGGGRGRGFTEQGGEALYKNICQGCHMPNAQGGVGAGMYPALAKNPKLEVAGYPISVVVNGQKAMPAFGPMLSDQQIADVINYVRTHFGNNYKDAVKPADVKAARP
ncbi:MAG TPA: cytochrome c [Rhizomicrobium sp.]|nr:cytochrome c [Rhizomicrobium sp.]